MEIDTNIPSSYTRLFYSPLANKDKDDAYNRAYKPPTNIKEDSSGKDNSKEEKEEEEDNSSNENSTSDSAGNSKD
ncbi:hypothetical protein P8C59_007762 [Phyllachora maydis]|uniref:Uncharacterized protein n=1 Tax=Phyllachora maydis TaxID=1825666 RepID=A0AAD9IAV9_9PEZI|nr:hypothetical protein P8C59_007762 [Phyllachora maydis]